MVLSLVRTYSLFFFCTFLISNSLNSQNTVNFDQIIPQPVRITTIQNQIGFNLQNLKSIYSTVEFNKDPLSEFIKWVQIHHQIEIARKEGMGIDGINLIFSDSLSKHDAYQLDFLNDRINLYYKNVTGIFYALQSLKQLFPSNPDKKSSELVHTTIPAISIYDYPSFPYRGMHLDESRHFFGKEAVKTYIDMLAYMKMNYFHWHLTDDQGWRLEIKQYPKLTEVAACRKETLIGHFNDRPAKYDGKPYCYYYTQEDAKEIVKYAAERFVTVIPEIEMPGHASALLAAFPELSCHEKPIETVTTWGIFEDILCPKEETFEFLENVLDEVIAIFPSPYIHIGGDEAPKKQWEESAFCQELLGRENLKDVNQLQSWFIQRIDKYVSSKGRTIIGWDEILEGGLSDNAIVMSWRGFEGGLEAANHNHSVIMSPTSHCYFDYYQSKNDNEPLSIGGFLPLRKVYEFNPIPPELPKDKRHFILGGQANIWTEYIGSVDHLQYMAYPRALALAEVLWTPVSLHNYDKFLDRLTIQLPKLEAMGINMSRNYYNLTANGFTDRHPGKVFLETDAKDFVIKYQIISGKQITDWQIYQRPFELKGEGNLRYLLSEPSTGKVWAESNKRYREHAIRGSKTKLRELPHEKYSAGGKEALTNGFIGGDNHYGGDEWLGFYGKDIDLIVEKENDVPVRELSVRFFHAPGQWIHQPAKVEIYSSDDGLDFKKLPAKTESSLNGNISYWRLYFNPDSSQFYKILIKRHGIIGQGNQGAGHEAWLFADEINLK